MSSKILFVFLLIFSTLSFSGCAQEVTTDKKESVVISKPAPARITVFRDTVLKARYGKLAVTVTLKYTDTIMGQILVLPGWNYPDTQWCEKTVLCDSAKKMGFTLVFVEMQRSVYLRSYHKETKSNYRLYPTRTWLIDSVITPLFGNGLLDSTKSLFVMGLSTGGRGAAILALDYPTLFKGAASLSGDFDPELQKDDLLMINSLGPYAQFGDRWRGNDNMVRRVKEYKVPLYIGHGLNDKVSPPAQSIRFSEAIRRLVPSLRVETHFPKAMGHDYRYWGSEVSNILHFFSSL